jgi:tRNA modification GTPase
LLQAEAVLDLIHAGSIQAADAALRSLSGDFSKLINKVQQELIYLRSYVEAAIDFPEEEIDFLSSSDVTSRIDALIIHIKTIFSRVSQGVLLTEGVDTVILGEPNVGKSSLLNCLTKEDTSIITNIPGTTRDLIKATVNLNGVSLNLVDTAGIRESTDVIEQEGIIRAQKSAKTAELIIYIVDKLPNDLMLSDISKYKNNNNKLILVINKIDELNIQPKIELNNILGINAVYVSAKNNLGINLLEQVIDSLLGNVQQEGAFSARTRHLDALKTTLQHIEQGKQQLRDFNAAELLAEELKLAQCAINHVTGEFSADDLLGKIFSEFCIGK